MKIKSARAALIGAVFVLATPAIAAEGAAEPAGPASAVPFGTGAMLGADELQKIAGEADIAMQVRAQNSSTVANNSVGDNSVTGTIGFDGQAFQNLNGLALVSANTGNNVSINSSLNVNVALTP